MSKIESSDYFCYDEARFFNSSPLRGFLIQAARGLSVTNNLFCRKRRIHMPGLGTIINVLFIILGGIAGLLFGSRLRDRTRETLLLANAVAVLFIGIAGALQQMYVMAEDGRLETTGTMMLIASLAIGAVVGELLNLEGRLEAFGDWLKKKTGSQNDSGFTNAFVTASLTVCIGAMAVVGAIEDGAAGNPSILYAKAVLDLIIILVMAASLGKGALFSAIPVGLLQGSITALAVLIRPYITDTAMNHLSLVGSVLIFCVGVNLFWGKKIRVANLLPGLIVAVAWAALIH